MTVGFSDTTPQVPMAREHGFGEETTGLILSSFFAGYACTQVAGGWAAAAAMGGRVVQTPPIVFCTERH